MNSSTDQVPYQYHYGNKSILLFKYFFYYIKLYRLKAKNNVSRKFEKPIYSIGR